MTAKKIIVPIVVTIVILAILASTFWAVGSIGNSIKEAEAMRIGIDLDEAFQDGYEAAAIELTAEYNIILSELTAEYNATVNLLLADAHSKLIEHEIIKGALAAAEYDITELANFIGSLQKYIAECEALIKEMQTEIIDLKEQIEVLEEIRASLLQAIEGYKQLIASIPELEGRFVVTFMFDDTVYSILLIPDGNKVEIANPISTEYTIFLGWSLSLGGELIDLTELEITQDTVLYAKIIRKYDVNFIFNYAVYRHRIVERNHTTTAPTPTSTDRRHFLGWSLDGATIIDVEDFPITEHRNFFAVVETRHEVRFILTRGFTYRITILSTQFICTSNTLTVPIAPTYVGYIFDGWRLNASNGQRVNPANRAIEGDTVYVAAYLPWLASFELNNMNFNLNSSTMYHEFYVLDWLYTNRGFDTVTDERQIRFFGFEISIWFGGIEFKHEFTNMQLDTDRVLIQRIGHSGSQVIGHFYCTFLFIGGSLLIRQIFIGWSTIEVVGLSMTVQIRKITFLLNDF
jgi:hypothetical protein